MISVLVTLSVLSVGVILRKPIIATANIEIGGVLMLSSGGIVRNESFDSSQDIEYFISHYVFKYSDLPLAELCKAESLYSPDKPNVRIICKSESGEQARELISATVNPVMERHAKQYAIAKALYEQGRDNVENKISYIGKAIQSLQEEKNLSRSLEFELAGLENRKNELLQEKKRDELLGERVRMTEFKPENVHIKDRTPGWGAWAILIGMSLVVGVMISLITGISEKISESEI